jgi:hypothetical protein
MEKREEKEIYVEPRIVATYTKEELEETIKPHGNFVDYNETFPP